MADEKITDFSEELVVDGYAFPDRASAGLARNELESIQYLSKKVNYNDNSQLLALYERLTEEGLFKTQVGIEYMRKLQRKLMKDKDIMEAGLKPIPVQNGGDDSPRPDRELATQRAKNRLAARETKKYKSYFAKSLLFNFILVAAIIIMFVITATSSNPNILNYESKLQDRYASWEEDLKTREAELNARERALQGK
jgi:hypothetical protein